MQEIEQPVIVGLLLVGIPSCRCCLLEVVLVVAKVAMLRWISHCNINIPVQGVGCHYAMEGMREGCFWVGRDAGVWRSMSGKW